MVNVTKDNFLEQSNDLIAHLPSASFVAIDEEMTGINLPGSGRPRKDETPGDRYQELKQVPERYSIIQLGISLFHEIPEEENEDGEVRNEEEWKLWRVRRYNFYMFPDKDSERDVVMSPGAVAFLNRFNMSFDQWVKEGIPYSTVNEAIAILERYVEKQTQEDKQAKESPPPPTIQQAARRVELRRADDMEFFSRCMASLREWIDSPIPRLNPAVSEGTSFLLPACNSFMRRAFYESIQIEYPSLVLENAGPDNPNQIRVWRLDEEERRRRDERLRREAWENVIVNKVGLARVFMALSYACRGVAPDRRSALFAPAIHNVDWNLSPTASMTPVRPRKIPLVVHNGFMDIAFMLTHFVQPKLPPDLSDCKALIRQHFPLIYDTKVMATECSPTQHNENTGLGNLFERIGQAGLMNRIENVTLSANAPPDQEHEAAYDAFMTGVCFIGICNELQGFIDPNLSVHDDAKVSRNLLGRNKLFQMSMYTMDLENPEQDPMSRGMLQEATYRVSDIDPNISTRDIVRCLSGLTDEAGRRVMYEIIWIDDTTFLVAVSYREGMVGKGATEKQEETAVKLIRQHGLIIREALARRFSEETVKPLQEYLASLAVAQQGEARLSIFSRVAELFGFGKRKHEEDVETGTSAKRRRLY